METQAYQKLKKAQIKIQGRNPFFSYLSLFLKFQEAKKGDLPEWAGMGVAQDGTLVFKADFVNKCSDEECMGVLAHEILHLALLHLTRRGSKQQQRWNIANDLVVNSILIKNGFTLTKNGLIPQGDSFTIQGKTINNISTKISEQIYDELPDMKEQDGKGQGSEGFDEHREGKGQTQQEKEENENEWLNRLDEAVAYSKQKGNLPMGMDRLIGKLHKSKLNWRALLRKHITNELPSDYSWAKCSKKGISSGYWLPNTLKEKIDVVIAIDTSGSIQEKEFMEFLGEIVGMAKAYQSQIDMRLLTHDTKVQNDFEVKNGNVAKILSMKLKGYGGTNFECVFDYIKQKRIKPKILVALTDGYFNKIKKPNFPMIWVLNKDSTDENVKGTGVIIKIED